MKIFILIVLLCSICRAGTIDPNTPYEKYVEYGKNFPCVGKITGEDNEHMIYRATAVAIDSHHVLTAAHVIKNNAKACYFILSDEEKLEIKKIKYADTYDLNIFGEGDIAICYIEKNIGLDQYPELYTDTNEIGKKCSIVGYGCCGTFLTGQQPSDLSRRAGLNTIDYIENKMLVCSPSKPNDNCTELEFLICSGDSGGALFIDAKLAGINSCIFKVNGKPDGKYGTMGGHTRVSKYIDWINNNKTK